MGSRRKPASEGDHALIAPPEPKLKCCLPPKVLEAADDYGAALAEVCVAKKIDPVAALKEPGDFPKLGKEPMMEFIMGWFDGVAAMVDRSVSTIWLDVVIHGTLTRAQMERTVTRKKRKR